MIDGCLSFYHRGSIVSLSLLLGSVQRSMGDMITERARISAHLSGWHNYCDISGIDLFPVCPIRTKVIWALHQQIGLSPLRRKVAF